MILCLDDVVLWPIWEAGDVLGTVLANDQNVMFAVTACTGLALALAASRP